MQIHYTKGDATKPIGDGNKIVTHICNDIGAWGRGFVLAISKRWEFPELAYKKWYQYHRQKQSGLQAQTFDVGVTFSSSEQTFALGQVQFVQVEQDIIVANMIGQFHIRKAPDGTPPIRYEAVSTCLRHVCAFAKERRATIHMPRIGSGLAGGNWDEIEGLIRQELTEKGVDVWIYDL